MPVEIVMIQSGNAHILGRTAPDVFDHDPPDAHIRAYLAAPGHALFVAVEAGEVIGQARGVLHIQPDAPSELYIDNLGVTPGHKRRGVATRLLRALIAWGADRGGRSVWVATEVDNDEARGFYGAFGFTGETMAYFQMEDAVGA
ncbi:GNAT family N-acetyltransferase [bacterium]|nr:GNAT family N-acetyltransferase [bacterium]